MSARIMAELPALARGEEAFSEVLKELRKILADLDRDLSAGLSEWTGEAKIAHQHAHARWRAAADDMANSLDRLRQVIGIGHRNYGRSLAANITMWHGE